MTLTTKLGAKLVNLAKLGFFVGWGVVATLAAACGGRAGPAPGPQDARPDVQQVADGPAKQDAGVDAGLDAGPRDAQSGWDVPLE
jgi:hypothetical protein